MPPGAQKIDRYHLNITKGTMTCSSAIFAHFISNITSIHIVCHDYISTARSAYTSASR